MGGVFAVSALVLTAVTGCGLVLDPDLSSGSRGDASPLDSATDSDFRDARTDGMNADALLDALPSDATTDGIPTDSAMPLSGCDGAFGPAMPLTEINTTAHEFAPSLTADMLELYFVSDRDGGMGEIFVARRGTLSEPFGTPVRVAELGTPSLEGGSHVSLDGRTIYFASERGGSMDIWKSQRPERDVPWTRPVRVDELSTVTADSGPSLVAATGDIVFAIGVERRANIFLATAAVGGGFEPYVQLSTLNAMNSDRSPFMSDALTIFFTSDRMGAGGSDIYCAQRTSDTDSFDPPAIVDSLASSTDNDDPWLSPDGRTIYFTRETPSGDDLFVATR